MTSVEYDRDVASRARRALAHQGCKPTLVVGDGASGQRGSAPYDRLIATYSVTSVPQDWIAQMRPGGIIVCSLHHDLDVGLMLALTVDDHGAARGKLLSDEAYFMPTRLQDHALVDDLLITAAASPAGEKRISRLSGIIPDPAPSWAVLAALLHPGVTRVTLGRAAGPVQWLLHPDGSWAFYDPQIGEVEQGGPRELWTAVERIYELWNRIGRPTRTRIGLTCWSGVESVWIDRPDLVLWSSDRRTHGSRGAAPSHDGHRRVSAHEVRKSGRVDGRAR